jgi:hypothetical protein
MTYFILSVVILFIGKFIYDSFLTNNTEKNWDAYKKSNPNQAIVLETNSAFNLNIKATLRTDGYYLANHTGKDYQGKFYTIPLLFVFNNKGLVAFCEDDEANSIITSQMQDLKEQLIEIDLIEDIEISTTTSKYRTENGAISMQFYDPSEASNTVDDELLVYNEWKGTILNNGLLLTFSQAGYNSSLKDYTKQIVLKDLKFDFVQIKF